MTFGLAAKLTGRAGGSITAPTQTFASGLRIIYITAPDQSHVSDGVVYMALMQQLTLDTNIHWNAHNLM